MDQKTQDELESIIDKQGLCTLLTAIADICALKADHVRENWQDNTTAKAWDWNAEQVQECANRVND
jgi:hypothetical protein